MPAEGENLSVFPEGMGRDGTRIHDAADYTDELVAYTRSAREPLGTPWGEKGEYAEQMQKLIGESEEYLYTLLDYIAVAQRQAADGTVGSAGSFQAAEDANTDIAGTVGGEGQQGGRR
ncbi:MULTISPECIES: hypothetical protein [unclassified Nocardiopsis]|uniref:hypothetical protein n=1 Tax=Nocardiopsis TaxID=2013 RepID=UPI00387B1D73